MTEDLKTIKDNFLKLDYNTKSELLTEFIHLFMDDKEEEKGIKLLQAKNLINLLCRKVRIIDSSTSINSVCKKEKLLLLLKIKNFKHLEMI